MLEVIGDSPRCRVLDFLLAHAGFDYSKTQVAREAGISRITIEGIWGDLLRKKFIKKTRNIANAQLCVLNAENPQVKALAQLDYLLAEAKSEKEFEKQVLKARA